MTSNSPAHGTAGCPCRCTTKAVRCELTLQCVRGRHDDGGTNARELLGAGGMWSVVTPVPAGTHEFKFVVDGEWKHSTRHPTVGEDEETMNNIRVIRGPPKNKMNSSRMSEQRNKEAGAVPRPKKKSACCVVS